MKRLYLSDFPGGWILGDFSPSVLRTRDFEVCIKFFQQGDLEPEHFQKQAHEVTFVAEGSCKISTEILNKGEGLLIEPGIPADFEALTDCVVIGIKWPSIPADKILVSKLTD